LLALALALAACGLSRPEVASVGDRDVADVDLGRAVALQRALAELRGAPCGQSVAGESEGSACNRVALSGELLWLAVVGYANAHAIAPADAEVEQAVGQLETQVGRDALDEALGSRDLTRRDLFELGRRILTIRRVRTSVAEARVGDARLRALYEQRALEFTVVQADHILVKTEAEARDVYDRVKNASEEEFVALARKVSIEPGAKQRGGELGSAAASGYVPEFAKAAAALRPGQVSRPVQTQLGWHVIYLVDKEVTPFQEAKGGLIEPLADREFSGWLEARARELGVEVNPLYGRFEPTTFSVSPVRSTDPDADTGRAPS
jgi:PPIC-type peptidyl-prolyl cis-trans isomerase-like protein